VIQDRWDIEHMAHLINRHQVTNFAGTDELIMRLLATSNMERPFPSVRWCGYATFSAGLGHWFDVAEARGLRPVGLYGASEVQALFALQDPSGPIDVRCRDGGFPVSARAQVRVRDNETGRLLPVGEVGELETLGPSQMACYEGDASATDRAVTSDGFVHIGDYGRFLENGSFLFAGHSGDWLRLSGFLVAPAEIEAIIEKLPGIQGCQIVGADWKGAQRPFAFVTLQAGATLDEQTIRDACGVRLARYKVPVRVEDQFISGC
jgi:fatty-acyl-CoA synthase